jgi:hypothetical protein
MWGEKPVSYGTQKDGLHKMVTRVCCAVLCSGLVFMTTFCFTARVEQYTGTLFRTKLYQIADREGFCSWLAFYSQESRNLWKDGVVEHDLVLSAVFQHNQKYRCPQENLKKGGKYVCRGHMSQ